jgi:soluble lytic murein transglycosylase-like protein
MKTQDKSEGNPPESRDHARKAPVVLLATVLFLAVSVFESTPSVPSVLAVSEELPDPQEILALEEIASWLSGAEGPDLMSSKDLNAALRERSRSFELFCSYPEAKHRRDVLLQIPFGEHILEAAYRHELDALLVAAVVEVESGFVPTVVSPKGAVGLMQVLPSTAGTFAESLTDPAINLEAGASYLRSLLERFSGDLELALAAYNAGPGAVARYGGVPPYRETQHYVNRVMSAYVGRNLEAWDASGTTEILAQF